MINWFIVCGYLIGLNVLLIGYLQDMSNRKVIKADVQEALSLMLKLGIAFSIVAVIFYSFLLSYSVFKLCMVFVAVVILGRNIKPFILGPVTIVYFTGVLLYIKYFLM